MNRIVMGLIGCMLVGLWGCEEEPVLEKPIRLVRAIQLAQPSDTFTAELSGRASADQEVELAFRVTGKLNEFPAKVGEEVRPGEVLGKLDPRDFEVALLNIEGQLARAQADVEVAKTDVDRSLRIQAEEPGAISQALIDQRIGALKQAEGVVVSTQAQLDDVTNALADTVLRSPLDGVVTATYVNNFEEVQAKQPVLRLVDASKIKFTFQMPEQHITKLHHVKSFVCEFDAHPGLEVPATLDEVASEASKTTRTYAVKVVMDQPEGVTILPGMSGRVKVVVDVAAIAGEGQMVVPPDSVFYDLSGNPYVWIVEPTRTTVSRRPVEPGQLDPNGLRVQGLKEGMWVVTAGVHFLEEGQRVRLPVADGGQQ